MSKESARKSYRHSLQMLFLLFLVVGTVLILLRRCHAPIQENEGPVFGTYYHIKYQSPTDLHDAIRSELKRVDASLSLFNKESQLSKVNLGQSDRADALMAEVLSLAHRVSVETEGSFDVTVAPLVNAWGFGTETERSLSQAQIDSLLAFVGYDKISLSGHTVVKADPRVQIDCGAIAKGYAVDRIARLLKEQRVENFMIEIGGEIVAHGRNAEGELWRIGIEQPNDDVTADALQTIIEMQDGAVATSGNYRNFYYKDGQKIAHTIDPRTGQPVVRTLLSATVLAPTCAEADAYATALMVMGTEKAREFLKNNPRLTAYLIVAEGDNLKMERIN